MLCRPRCLENVEMIMDLKTISIIKNMGANILTLSNINIPFNNNLKHPTPNTKTQTHSLVIVARL